MTYIIILILLFVMELAYFGLASRFNIIDKPNLRSSHTRVTLRGGGIIFLIGAWLYAAFFGFQYIWFLTGLTLIAAVSFIDDIRSLPDSLRLVVQFIAMFMMFHQFGILNPSDWWIVVIALIVCVGITNAYNFMDGINGITGGYSVAVILPLIYLDSKLNFIDMPFLYVTFLSLLVFCFFNFRRRARCFAGDVGSITIAFIIIFALGKLILATGNFAYIIFLALYGVDAVMTICHRIMLGENLGKAHRKHAYQLMANELKMPHVAVASIYMILQLIISFGMIFCPVNNYIYLAAAIVILAAAYIMFMRRYYHLHDEYLKSKEETSI